MIRIAAAFILATLLVTQLFTAVTRPVRATLAEKYVALADTAMVAGDYDRADELLQKARRVQSPESDAVVSMQNTLNSLRTDLFAEKAFMQERGNSTRAERIEVVVQDYTDPKSILTNALELARADEPRLAEQLLTRADKKYPAYQGNQLMREYIEHEYNR